MICDLVFFIFRSIRSILCFYPPSQKTTIVRSWMNAKSFSASADFAPTKRRRRYHLRKLVELHVLQVPVLVVYVRQQDLSKLELQSAVIIALQI